MAHSVDQVECPVLKSAIHQQY